MFKKAPAPAPEKMLGSSSGSGSQALVATDDQIFIRNSVKAPLKTSRQLQSDN